MLSEVEIWSQAELESTRLLQRAEEGLRGPGRQAEGIEKVCGEKTLPTPTLGYTLLQLLLPPEPELTPAGHGSRVWSLESQM